MKKIIFTKLSETAKVPVKAHKSDAGWDLFTDEAVTVEYGQTVVIPTNIAIQLPEGYVADIRPRSGLTLKTSIRVHYGTIDSGYRDGIGIIVENSEHTGITNYVFNLIDYFSVKKEGKDRTTLDMFLGLIEQRKETTITIKKGTKLAQMVILKLPEFEFVEGSLDDSERGQKGFGSTGTR